MDYLEGLLLGVQWSDTDFENKRHISSLALYGVLVNLLIVYSYFTGHFSGLFGGNLLLKIILFLVLFLGCPFVCFRYFRFPIWAKIPILAAQACKQCILTLIITAVVLPRIGVSSGNLQQTVVDYLNNTLEAHTEKYVDSAGTFATVLGVMSGGIYIVFVTISAILLALIIPGAILYIVRLLQLGYDKLVAKFILADHLDR